jgi:hypothetical protein
LLVSPLKLPKHLLLHPSCILLPLTIDLPFSHFLQQVLRYLLQQHSVIALSCDHSYAEIDVHPGESGDLQIAVTPAGLLQGLTVFLDGCRTDGFQAARVDVQVGEDLKDSGVLGLE